MSEETVHSFTKDELTELINSALSAERAAREEETKALRDQVAGLQQSLAGNVVTMIPRHAGGLGGEIHETWSMWEQYLARMDDETRLAQGKKS